MVMPGDNVEMLCEIGKPIALENGQRFNIREGTYISGTLKRNADSETAGGRTVATGLVTRVIK